MFNVKLSVITNTMKLEDFFNNPDTFNVEELNVELGEIDVLNLDLASMTIESIEVDGEIYEFTKIHLHHKKVKEFENSSYLISTENPQEVFNQIKNCALLYFTEAQFLIDEQKKYQGFIQELLEIEAEFVESMELETEELENHEEENEEYLNVA